MHDLLRPLMIAVALFALPAAAQEDPPTPPPIEAPAAAPGEGAPDEGAPEEGAPEEGLRDEEAGEAQEVRESQPNAPSEQGMLQPDEEEAGEGQGEELYTLLSRVRAAPPGLDGEPIERPNPLGSEPEIEMEPVQPREVYLFPEDYIE